MLELIREIVRRVEVAEPVAICSVARTRGSTPQKAGAFMLVLQSGDTLGTLGGGCVEAEVRMRAMQLMLTGDSRLLTFKLDNDYGWDDGLVCGGTMEIAIQTLVSPEAATEWQQAGEALAAGRSATLRVRVKDRSGEPVTFEHEVPPVPALVIAGAGHVGGALHGVARSVGFAVTVVDDRPDLATADRFPGATLVVGEIDAELRRLPIGPNTYIVIVTRGHRHDAQALAAVVASEAKYIGLIGSRRKIGTILQQLQQDGVSRERLDRVHAPIGVRIGAVTPEEIAVSIAAELVAVRRGVELGETGSMRLAGVQRERMLNAE